MTLRIASTMEVPSPQGNTKEVMVQFIGENLAFIDYISGTVKLGKEFLLLTPGEKEKEIIGALKKELFPEPFNADKIQTVSDQVDVALEKVTISLEKVEKATRDMEKMSTFILKSDISDSDYQKMIEIYDEWSPDFDYEKGKVVRWSNRAWEVIQPHASQLDWEPQNTPALFKVVTPKRTTDPNTGEEVEVIEDFSPRDGSNGYPKGKKVRFEGNIYESKVDSNVYSPSEYAQNWELIAE